MREYLKIFRYPGATSMLLASIPARFAYAMIGLDVYFKTFHAVHSIAFAGLVAGVNGVAGSLTTSIRSSLLDKFGMRTPLRFFVPAYALAILFLITVNSRSGLLLAGLLLGLFAPPVNLSIRPLWRFIVPPEDMRKALALDSSVMTGTIIVGPVAATYLSLSHHPSSALIACSSLIFLGGISLSMLRITKEWAPEPKRAGDLNIFAVPGIRILMLEGIFIGIGAGMYQIAVPAFTSLRHVEHLTGNIIAVGSCASIVGSLLAGIFGKHLTPLKAFMRNYLIWAVVGLPLAFTTPGWSLMLVAGLIGLSNGAQQVFYMEVIEAVRPHGTAASALGWMWTVEGSAAAVGAWIGGTLSQTFSPQLCFACTSGSVALGAIVVYAGKQHLLAADRFGPRPD